MKVIQTLAANQNFRLVSVVFGENQTRKYTYMLIDELIKVGDYVVVVTPSGELKVTQVVEVLNPLTYDGFTPLKWAIQRLDLDKYQECKETSKTISKTFDDAAIAKRNKALFEELRAELDETAVTTIRNAVVRL